MNRQRPPMTDEQLEARLRELPEIADSALSSLTATEALRQRILRAAANPEPARARRPLSRGLVPALAMALVLVVGGGVGLRAWRAQQEPGQLITSQAAGDPTVTNHLGLLDIEEGNVSVAASQAPKYRSLWEAGSNGTFPLIGLNGSYYRMMTTPKSVSSGKLGGSLGAIAEFTTEPSLSGTDVILSNAAGFGAQVYEIRGMGGTLVAAEVDGKTRLFQRVSFNGSALKGRETLADTMQIAGHITSMALSDVGTVTDAATCEALWKTLLDNASYDSSSTVSARQSLLIELDNGLTVQMAVRNDKLSACGTWSCPEFFEAFEDALD